MKRTEAPPPGRKHELHKCDADRCGICDGGLSSCNVCGGGEASLPTHCPGSPMSEELQKEVQSGDIDFVRGEWIRLRITAADSIGAKIAHVRREAAKGQGRPHHCHADGCEWQCPPAYFMCPRHWRMVPAPLQRAVWREYAIAQERGEAGVSEEYLRVTREAIAAVARLEGRPVPA